MSQLVDRLRERLENWATESVKQAGEIGDLKRWLTEVETERDALKAAIWASDEVEEIRHLARLALAAPETSNPKEILSGSGTSETPAKPGIDGEPVPDRIDYDDNDELDDVVVNNCDAHLERLSAGRWYLGLYGDDGRILQITIGSKTGRAEVTGVVTYSEGIEDGDR